ncbi:hypothetical protein EPA93_28560 [Ktedonosporobacter rubrisoli]|uniref:Uncharacterized protein n=1 Tax=Ktedonosporobacter rubrisoli TaxID=2509675 RepID=A0A4P6JXG4_KTERU|nr:hypothetical protein [Ktedonosporobacter rubrisoli]QBD79716.1 hypothetical protein EPA93_28560 [Ktedonosporobacter rubrisoli]
MTSIVDLDSTTLHNIFEAAQLFVSFCIALRAFYLYGKAHNSRLFILWLALSFIALTSAVSIVGDNHWLAGPLNTNWFKYIAQAVSFFFIWLSTFRGTERYLHLVRNLHIVGSVLLLGLLLATPLLPGFPNAWLQVTLSSLRAAVCLCIFFQYLIFFFSKATHFSFLMGAAFLFISFGYLVIFPKYLLSNQDLLTNTGDCMRIFGLVILLIAYLIG